MGRAGPLRPVVRSPTWRHAWQTGLNRAKFWSALRPYDVWANTICFRDSAANASKILPNPLIPIAYWDPLAWSLSKLSRQCVSRASPMHYKMMRATGASFQARVNPLIQATDPMSHTPVYRHNNHFGDYPSPTNPMVDPNFFPDVWHWVLLHSLISYTPGENTRDRHQWNGTGMLDCL